MAEFSVNQLISSIQQTNFFIEEKQSFTYDSTLKKN